MQEKVSICAKLIVYLTAVFNREDIERTEQLTRRNANAIARLDEKMEQYIAEGREHREFIATQVEGIKVETRRILTHIKSG